MELMGHLLIFFWQRVPPDLIDNYFQLLPLFCWRREYTF